MLGGMRSLRHLQGKQLPVQTTPAQSLKAIPALATALSSLSLWAILGTMGTKSRNLEMILNIIELLKIREIGCRRKYQVDELV